MTCGSRRTPTMRRVRSGLPTAIGPLPAAAAVLAAAGAIGCGGGRSSPDPPVRLELRSPPDAGIVRGREIALRGRVAPPQASVLVAGRPVSVEAGAFTASVSLRNGVNVIDVLASADGRSPAMTALRVTRQATVEVPDVAGLDPAGAADRLAAAGLRVRLRDESDLLDDLLVPLTRRACETDPAAGSTVARGATVIVKVAKIC